MYGKQFSKSITQLAQFKVLIDETRVVINLNRKTQNDLSIGLILGSITNKLFAQEV